jgi:hypothetical protein
VRTALCTPASGASSPTGSPTRVNPDAVAVLQRALKAMYHGSSEERESVVSGRRRVCTARAIPMRERGKEVVGSDRVEAATIHVQAAPLTWQRLTDREVVLRAEVETY